jgi:hypothetical protein
MEWEVNTLKKFKGMIDKIPLFHRGIAQNVVTKKSEENAKLRGGQYVEEQDVVSAFFSDVPIPFYSMMVRLLEQSGFDYKQYGFPGNHRNFK